MKISTLKTLTTPNLNDLLPILDINGGVSGKPVLRKATLQSLLELALTNTFDPTSINDSLAAIITVNNSQNTNISNLQASIADYSSQINSINSTISTIQSVNTSQDAAIAAKLTTPAITKTSVLDSELIVGLDSSGIPYKVTKANLLVGLSGGTDYSSQINSINSNISTIQSVNTSQDAAIAAKLTTPAITKTSVLDSELIVGIDGNGTPFNVSKANLLSGLASTGVTEYFSRTVFLSHFNGANNSTIITDTKGATITRYGDAKISTAQAKFSNGSLFLDGTGDCLSFPYSVEKNICSEDFKWETWLYPTSLSGTKTIFAQWSQVSGSEGFLIRHNGTLTNILFASFSTSTPMFDAGVINLNAWNYMAFWRIGNRFTLQLNSNIVGVVFSNAIRNITTVPFTIGSYVNTSSVPGVAGTEFTGYLNEMRISKPASYSNSVPSSIYPD